MTMTPEEFMAAAPRGMESNSEWGRRYARELRNVIVRQATLAPRSQQVHLGPSEIGAECDRQIVSKLLSERRTNNVSDPWPSVVGTAVHAWLAKACDDDNERDQTLRWLTETRVTPHPDFPGSADLYDAVEQAVVDWKILGASSLSKVKSAAGPSRKYKIQLLLYGAGFRALGLPVKRVVLAALPRTASTLDGMFVWDHVCSPADEPLIREVLDAMAARKAAAEMVRAGLMQLHQIRATPSDDECFFCPYYRPQARYDGLGGCPGMTVNTGLSR